MAQAFFLRIKIIHNKFLPMVMVKTRKSVKVKKKFFEKCELHSNLQK